MVDAQRASKMADRIQQIVARRLEKGIKDPRIGFVTITDVKVTGDLQHASIFYTVYGSDEERADSAAALKSATGMFRTEVGKNITARLTPSLEFIPDGIPENAASIEKLLNEARQRDADSQSMAETAQYAGDADPYVKPREPRDDDADLDEVDEPGEVDPPRDGIAGGSDEPDGGTR
ncbi:ribosome-binding factor A [Frondihabitans sp. PAMC 28766]|uniref:30S ribosome-binding factor RbfA n=1 Tax=Frondihabitans sp. PAMC 28766 TaxID=1795630 RepID=UPI00078CA734|nr:30S ribosome-binding factor RbfA [Frondihabitans sp. PAMC 28766]AMM21124.1 ribosome-binding factor A [Frondihabitans sp. PAMC 28766]